MSRTLPPLPRRRRTIVRLGLVAWLVVLGGCPLFGSPALPDPQMSCEDGPPPGAAAVQLGVGQEGPFTPLDGQTIPFFSGPQGGQHVYVTLRQYGSGGPYWPADLRIADGAGVEVGRNLESLKACPGRWSVSRYLRVFLDRAAPIADATISVSTAPDGSTDAPVRARARVQVVAP